MDIERLKQRKKEIGLTLAEISERANIPLTTVKYIFSGYTDNPQG